MGETPTAAPPDKTDEVVLVATLAASLLNGYLPLVVGGGTPALTITPRDYAVVTWAVALARALLAETQRTVSAESARAGPAVG